MIIGLITSILNFWGAGKGIPVCDCVNCLVDKADLLCNDHKVHKDFRWRNSLLWISTSFKRPESNWTQQYPPKTVSSIMGKLKPVSIAKSDESKTMRKEWGSSTEHRATLVFPKMCKLVTKAVRFKSHSCA